MFSGKLHCFLSNKTWFLFFLKKSKDRKSGVDDNSAAGNNGGRYVLDFLFALQKLSFTNNALNTSASNLFLNKVEGS